MDTQKPAPRNQWFAGALKTWFFLLLMTSIIPSLQAQEGDEADANEGGDAYPSLKPSGFVQTHFSADDVEGSPATFSIHRARMGFTGHLSDNIKLNLIVGAMEPPNNSPALVNAFADFTIDPHFNLRAGQFFAPFGLEGPGPITLNPAIERAFSTRSMNPFRMFRDIGVMAYGQYQSLQYAVAIMNGSGANVPENINPKDFMARVEVTPIENLKAGISAHIGTYETGALNGLSRQRWGVHGEYGQTPLYLRGEFFFRNREIGADDRQQSTGGYLLGKYAFSEKWEAIGRYDYFTTKGAGDPYHGFTLGPNYQVGPNTQLALNGIFYTPVNDEAMYSLLTLQLQMVL